ncbi:hypothetical protein EGH90_10105 [Kaistella haifensis]|nr:hypothetical protein EGH90_10105 [Kaistella haifensis]
MTSFKIKIILTIGLLVILGIQLYKENEETKVREKENVTALENVVDDINNDSIFNPLQFKEILVKIPKTFSKTMENDSIVSFLHQSFHQRNIPIFISIQNVTNDLPLEQSDVLYMDQQSLSKLGEQTTRTANELFSSKEQYSSLLLTGGSYTKFFINNLSILRLDSRTMSLNKLDTIETTFLLIPLGDHIIKFQYFYDKADKEEIEESINSIIYVR